MANGINVRMLSLESLLAIHRDGRQSHLVIRDVLDKYGYLPERDRAFYVRLTEGTLEYQIRLDYIIDQFSKTKTTRMKPVILDILRMAVYQMAFMDSIPDSAAVNEAVRLAVKKGFAGLKGFVNGVLRNISRHLPEVQYPDRAEEAEEYLQVTYSMPAYLVRKWTAEFGFEATEKICAGFFEPKPTTVRVRTLISTSADLRAAGISPELAEKLTPAPYVDDAFYLEGAGNLASIPEFEDGILIAEDVSSELAVRAAGIKPGDTVYDLCAAPGGKTILAADLAGAGGHVFASDISGARTEKIRENLERCHVEHVSVMLRDASVSDPSIAEQADVVIADIPCTGYGVIGKKPDIRYRATEKNQLELIDLGRKILQNAAACVRPGGTLLFSTCTFGRAENQNTLDWLVQSCGLVPVDLSDRLPASLYRDDPAAEQTAKKGYVQLLPGIARCDGFFFAVLEKPGKKGTNTRWK